MQDVTFYQLIEKLPKTELHLHIEGSLEPELMWELAAKNNVTLPYQSIDEIKSAYNFSNLQEFLDVYYQGASVLCDEDDFFRLMWNYLLVCKQQNIVHAEIMFDPQTHTHRNIGFEVFMPGFARAIKKAQRELGISVYLIMCFLRHLSEDDALATLEQAAPYYDMIASVGLDSSELNNPPDKFKNVFAKAKALGFKCVAHAGEEGPAQYVWQAIQSLSVDRIDHGVRSIDDAKLVAFLRHHKIPITVCPLSNIRLCVFDQMAHHNILALLEEGLLVTVNADDPSYFGGYLNENYIAMFDALAMSKQQLVQLIKNGFEGSFLPKEQVNKWTAKIDEIASDIEA